MDKQYRLYDREVGKRIACFREKMGLNQEQLAAQMQIAGCRKIDRSTLGKIEVGERHVYTLEMKRFQQVLGVSYDELFPPVTREILAEEEKEESEEDGD